MVAPRNAATYPGKSARSTMLTAKCAPIAARSTFGDHANAHPGDSSTCSAPAAAALRSSVPTFPGSWISSSRSTSLASGDAAFAAGVRTAAITPVGDSTVESESKSASASKVTRAGAARSTSRATCASASPARLNITSRASPPESRKAASRCTPSSTDRPLLRRSPAFDTSRAIAL